MEALLVLAVLFAAREVIHYRQDRAAAQERSQERSDWAAERSSLLNRIKPETAQYVPLEEEPETPQPLRTDEEWWDEHGGIPQTIGELNGGS